jgi:hypothetical protein
VSWRVFLALAIFGLLARSPAAEAQSNYYNGTGHTLLPPTSSTLGGVFSATAPSNQFMTGINTSGAPTFAQPSASNLSNGTTGTGSVVLQASPSLTGTITLDANYTLSDVPGAWGGGNALTLVGSETGNNTFAVQSTSPTGYSSLVLRDQSNNEVAAVYHYNGTTGGLSLESSYLIGGVTPTSALPPFDLRATRQVSGVLTFTNIMHFDGASDSVPGRLSFMENANCDSQGYYGAQVNASGQWAFCRGAIDSTVSVGIGGPLAVHGDYTSGCPNGGSDCSQADINAVNGTKPGFSWVYTAHAKAAAFLTGSSGTYAISFTDIDNSSKVPLAVNLAGNNSITVGSGGELISGSSSGTTTLKAAATASGTLTLPAATDTLMTLGQTQTVSGLINFTGGLKAGGSPGLSCPTTATGTLTFNSGILIGATTCS